jgi:hypothetical protein
LDERLAEKVRERDERILRIERSGEIGWSNANLDSERYDIYKWHPLDMLGAVDLPPNALLQHALPHINIFNALFIY